MPCTSARTKKIFGALAAAAAVTVAVHGNAVTVDLNGNSFLESATTTAKAFEFVGLRAIPTAITAGTTAPVTLGAGISAVDLTVATSTTTAGGLRLPAAVNGLRIAVRSTSGRAYTLWPQSGAKINNGDSMTVLASEQIINCEALAASAWLCTAPDGYTRTGLRTEALTTAASTTVTIGSTTDVVDLTVGAASTTLTLPTPSLGKELTIHQKATTTIAYTLAAASGTYINDAGTTTTLAVTAKEPAVICRGMSATRWECTAPRGYKNRGLLLTVAADTTLTAADNRNIYTSVDTRTYTLPTCSSEKLEYEFFQHKNTLTITPKSTDYIISTAMSNTGASNHAAAALGTAITVAATTNAPSAGTINGGYARIICAQSGVWIAHTYKYSVIAQEI
jgi:hypothetical protein